MPLQQYVLVVGGALLVLLFATDWVFPRPRGEHEKSEVRLPAIRIHSDRKGPEAVVFDTARPIFMAPVEQDGAGTPQAIASTELSLTEGGSQLPGPVSEPAEPAELNEPKIQNREIKIGDHVHLTRRPLLQHPALSSPSNTIFAAPEGRMREVLAQAPTPLSRTPHRIRATTQDQRE
jgi:hypothetical protein